MSSPSIEVSKLSVTLKSRKVVDAQTWSHGRGILGLLGPNGAGKTTLLSVLGTLRRPGAGSVRIAGHDLRTRRGIARARALTGFLPQTGFYVPAFTVEETVSYALWLKNGKGRSLVREALERTNTAHLADRKMSRLSGGERQRVGIAQATVANPEVLLLDEPTASLDPVERRSVLEVLRNLSSTSSVIMSTHNVADLPGICDSVIAMSKGAVQFHGSLTDFAASDNPTPDDLEEAYGRALKVS